MLKNENIICISSIDWDFIWQGHQEIMSTFARNGNRVLFIENTGVRVPGVRDIGRIKNRIRNWFRGTKGIRKEGDNLYIYSPLVLPFPYSRIARWVNKYLILSVLDKWMKAVDFSDPIIWTFLPTPLSLDVIDGVMKKFLVYYCIDNFSASSVSARKIKRSEEALLKKTDVVFVTSKALEERCSKYNTKVYRFPFGVCLKEFEEVRRKGVSAPRELESIKRPIVGYIGGMHKWVDKDLIRKTAEKHPEYSFVFVGPIQTDVGILEKVKNIYFLGQKKHTDVPLFVNSFDVGIIPYLITDYTRNVYPTKLNEYLSLGKPVISTVLPEVELFNKDYRDTIYVARDVDEFDYYLSIGLKDRNLESEKRRIKAASENSWEKRIGKMNSLIIGEIARKKLDIEANWKETLIGFYRLTRKRVLKFAIYCLLAYILLFKTPFLWFLAKPLRIDNTPQRADVIVVFGGGVGETGSPGKSTIERARYASELYKEGYADKIIFSSGYTYTYNDAENMRLFAISAGVPKKDIILEQKANSAYENVKFSKEIVDRNGWDLIILVTSPYNMRRASLVLNRWAKGIRIIYLPVENSQFYDKSEGIKLEQIRAIVHEYLGIIYYWFKGYI